MKHNFHIADPVCWIDRFSARVTILRRPDTMYRFILEEIILAGSQAGSVQYITICQNAKFIIPILTKQP